MQLSNKLIKYTHIYRCMYSHTNMPFISCIYVDLGAEIWCLYQLFNFSIVLQLKKNRKKCCGRERRKKNNQKFLLTELRKSLFSMQSIWEIGLFTFQPVPLMPPSLTFIISIKFYCQTVESKVLSNVSESGNCAPNTEDQNELLKSFTTLVAKTLQRPVSLSQFSDF